MRGSLSWPEPKGLWTFENLEENLRDPGGPRAEIPIRSTDRDGWATFHAQPFRYWTLGFLAMAVGPRPWRAGTLMVLLSGKVAGGGRAPG